MIVLKPDNKNVPNPKNPSVFLAGSIDNGVAENWQERLEDELRLLRVNVYNPRRDNWDSNLVQDISDPEFNHQVNWELDNLEAVDFPFVYFSPTSKAPITLMELGSLRDRKNVVVCCPKGYWRRGNVQVWCHRQGWDLIDNLDTAIDILRDMIMDHNS